MRFAGRVALCAILVSATGAFTTCSSGRTSGGEDPPRTADDILEVNGSGATSVTVVSNDQDLDNEPLTFAISESPSVGSASFNSDRTVRLDLPSGFSGVTRFKYKITNSLGGFSISTAVVFVDVPKYRVIFAARNSSQAPELYVTDLIDSDQLTQATSGNLRLQNAWVSSTGATVAYERADPALLATTSELFFVRTTANAVPTKIPLPSGRKFITSSSVSFSDDGRWIAFATDPASIGGQATNLYALDTTSSSNPIAVGFSANLETDFVQWRGTQPTLYFMATPSATPGVAAYRANTGNLDAPQRITPFYTGADTNDDMLVSPDQTKVVLFGTHGGLNGAFLINPDAPNTETRITTDVPAGAVIESFFFDEDYTQLTYLWRVGTGANARLSVVDVSTSGTPRNVLNADITAFTELRPDDAAALITRGSGGSGADGLLYEVPLDGASSELRIASNVTGGVYDGTGDRVYLFSKTLAPAVIDRGNFDDSVSVLVRSATPPQATFVTPLLTPSAAIIEDPTAGLVLVNAAAPGKTLKLTDRDLASVDSFFPTTITSSP